MKMNVLDIIITMVMNGSSEVYTPVGTWDCADVIDSRVDEAEDPHEGQAI
jgi:hypothetical protein